MNLMDGKRDNEAGLPPGLRSDPGRQTVMERDASDLREAISAARRAGALLLEGNLPYALDQANLARGFLDEYLTRHGRPVVTRPMDDDSELGPAMRLKRRVAANTRHAKIKENRYNRLKAQNICVNCGNEPARTGQVLGDNCRNQKSKAKADDRTRERESLREIKAKR